MKIDYSKLTGIQFMMAVACFIQSSSLLTSYVAEVTKQDSWMVFMVGLVIMLPIIAVYAFIMKSYPDKTIIGVCSDVFGKVGGKIIAFLYLMYFILLTSLNTLDMGAFVEVALLPNTPTLLILAIFMFVCAMAVKGGVQVVCRYTTVFVAIAIFVPVITMMLAAPLVRFESFMPMLTLPPMKYVQGVHLVTMVPFGESIVFLMFTPNVTLKPEKFRRHFILGLILGCVNLFMVVLRDISILGNTMELFTAPSHEVIRLIYISTSLSRVEVLFAIIFTMLLFFKVCVLLYVTVMAIGEIFNLKTYKPLVYVTSAFLLVMSQILYTSNIEHRISGINYTPTYWTFFQLIIPLIIVIITLLKKKKNTTAAANNAAMQTGQNTPQPNAQNAAQLNGQNAAAPPKPAPQAEET